MQDLRRDTLEVPGLLLRVEVDLPVVDRLVMHRLSVLVTIEPVDAVLMVEHARPLLHLPIGAFSILEPDLLGGVLGLRHALPDVLAVQEPTARDSLAGLVPQLH